jgi:hypothetical protein
VKSITSEPKQLIGANDQVIGSTAGSAKPSVAAQRLPKGLSTLQGLDNLFALGEVERYLAESTDPADASVGGSQVHMLGIMDPMSGRLLDTIMPKELDTTR